MNKTFHIHIFKYKGKKKNGRGRKGKKEKRKKKHRRKLEMKERATEKQKRKERSVSCLQQHGQDAACRETTSDTSWINRVARERNGNNKIKLRAKKLNKRLVSKDSPLASTLTSSHPADGRGRVTLARRRAFCAPSPQWVPRTSWWTLQCFSSSTTGSGSQSHVSDGHSKAWVTTTSYKNGQFFFQILNSSLMTWSDSASCSAAEEDIVPCNNIWSLISGRARITKLQK